MSSSVDVPQGSGSSFLLLLGLSVVMILVCVVTFVASAQACLKDSQAVTIDQK